MGAVVVIGLALIAGAIWVLLLVLKVIAEFIEEASKSFEKTAAARKENRYTKGRDKLRPHVRSVIPTELDSFEKKLERTRTDFLEHAQKLSNLAPHPPTWIKEQFRALAVPRKNSGYAEMCIAEIEAILSPNPDSSTWAYKELEIINRQCKYPFGPPTSKSDKFAEFPIIGVDLQVAVFEVDESQVSKKNVNCYFAEDQNKVSTYNTRRADLIAKISDLNSAIEGWNKKSRILWERYVVSLKQMEDAELRAFQNASELYINACKEERNYFKRLMDGYKKGEKQSVIERLGFVLDKITLPGSVPHTWDIDFDEEQRIAVVDIGLPDVVHRPPYKTVMQKSGPIDKPLNQTERKELVPKVHPAILLRTAYEVFRSDTSEAINLLVVNGWVKFDDPATGINTKAYTASLMVARNQIAGLNLTKIDPIVAFNNLHGKSAGRLVEIIPIEPLLSLNRNDSRFVNAKEVLKGLGSETNLAAMDWQDFEHLIRELFEKEFSGRGAEVKITQASRDRGVDAVVFDPDPIHGGKYIIQAKRYTNTVDVSAVRDLCAVVNKEGASRGILVTTSTYGADAYAFANNEPVTLLNGAELLGLLKKHGYAFKINLEEARRSRLTAATVEE